MASYFDLLEVAKSCCLGGSAITDFISQQQELQRQNAIAAKAAAEAKTKRSQSAKEASIASKEAADSENRTAAYNVR